MNKRGNCKRKQIDLRRLTPTCIRRSIDTATPIKNITRNSKISTRFILAGDTRTMNSLFYTVVVLLGAVIGQTSAFTNIPSTPTTSTPSAAAWGVVKSPSRTKSIQSQHGLLQSERRQQRQQETCTWSVVRRHLSATPATTTTSLRASPVNIIIAGAPASGKGTQCEIIKQKFGVVHLSTGDMLRAAVAAGSEVGKLAKDYMDSGKLVPDEVIIGVVRAQGFWGGWALQIFSVSVFTFVPSLED